MGSILKGLIFIVLGFLMLAWFAFSIIYPPTRPSETYMLDWVLIVVRFIGGVSLLIGGVIQLLFGQNR